MTGNERLDRIGPMDLGDDRLTEQYNPRTARIDRADTAAIIDLLNFEDRSVPDVVKRSADAIASVVDDVAGRLSRGGRLFYVGAGTSGRLGVLDAAECPPTFGTDPEMVQGIIAGGPEALVRAREGVEDDEEAGRWAIRDAGVGPEDFVLGIAASGTTPFVRAAVEQALGAGAGTGLLTCSEPPSDFSSLVDHRITIPTGPEAIVGSTRLKAGTATKLVLNTITTATMVRLGKVYGNLMVDLRATSRKLEDRSLRIIEALTGLDRPRASDLLFRADGRVKTALAMQAMGVDRGMAEERLEACGGFLAECLARFPAAHTTEEAP
ncbi:MAG: N-acetylmuramic acid 6-phosphate etherase [marine benthic group bacterium]|nr:N-acetylmuramic acid 6-phosphate etherase [Gemmatimonadota bacterium]